MSQEQRDAIGRAIRLLGVTETSRRLEMSHEAALRLAVGARVHRGTEALAIARLSALGDGVTP